MPTQVNLVDTIRLHNQESYLDHPEAPVMFCNATNWKPKPFMTLIDFLDSVEDVNKPDYQKMALDDAMDHFNFINIETEPL